MAPVEGVLASLKGSVEGVFASTEVLCNESSVEASLLLHFSVCATLGFFHLLYIDKTSQVRPTDICARVGGIRGPWAAANYQRKSMNR